MRRIPLTLALLLLAIGCSPDVMEEFEGDVTGRIHGRFLLGTRVLRHGWVGMIELTGPPQERCGPGACGLAMEPLLTGSEWRPGVWRVVPPRVEDWTRPDRFLIFVAPNRVTRFEFKYEPHLFKEVIDF
jgi:hypothetical protein